MPIMRHLALAYPRDAAGAARDDEYMFGPALLAAPVIEPGLRRRTLHLPPGQWVDLWRSATYQAQSGGLRLRGAKLVRGERTVSVPAPLAQLPLFVKAGSVIPLLSPDVDTLAPYGRGRGLVHLRDRRGRLDLLAFPRGRSSASSALGQRLTSLEGARRWELRIRGPATRYRIQAALAALKRPFTPCAVELGARVLPGKSWSFDPRTRVLRVSFRARSARLAVLGTCRQATRTTGR
jgi:hypothetical protein